MHAPAIKLHRHMAAGLCAGAFLLLAGCANGPTVDGGFDRSYTVAGHTRLDVSNASGDITITGSADGKVHVHGDVRASGSGQQDAQKRLAEVVSNPPVEQTAEGVRVGRDVLRLHNSSISYVIEVPRDTEVSGTGSSGTLKVRGLRGPIKLQSISGNVHAEDIDGDAQLTSISGSVFASNMRGDVRASSTSGDVDISGAKGDLRVNNETGSTQINQPGGRVEVTLASGSLNVRGATGDIKAHGVSGSINVQGNPAANSYWDLKNTSGAFGIGFPASANFHLLAESTSGEIRADVPIMIEEQGKHSLRAQVGTGGGRIEVHSVSGDIHLVPSN